MDVEVLTISLEGNKIESRDVPKIRGYLAGKFPQYLELHNHLGGNKFNYSYPVVQYKSIGKIPNIIAINEATRILLDVFHDVKEIDIKDKVMSILEKGYILKKRKLGLSNEMIGYRFMTPWLALNQENYKRYLNADPVQKKDILERILTGNILSMAKGLDYWAKEPVKVLTELKPLEVNYKNKKMIGFRGSFVANFMIPDYLGLGRSVAKGFGTVKRAEA
ncbi:MAG: CRISPR-associated endonuclease Cas6 [Clostridium sp.]|nr:CRISPR-associated endonuclease Cas6 [Clostridium sp.]